MRILSFRDCKVNNMANSVSRARMIIKIAHNINITIVDIENCQTMANRINWEELEYEDNDLLLDTVEALQSLNIVITL